MTELGTRAEALQAPRVSGVFAVPGFAGWPVQGSPKEKGKALRARVPRAAHAELTPTPTGRTS